MDALTPPVVANNFNPRSSREERLIRRKTVVMAMISIHAPRGRSDLHNPDQCRRDAISIHAPRGRSDVPADCHSAAVEFQSSTRGRGNKGRENAARGRNQYQSTLRAEERQPAVSSVMSVRYFNPRSSREERTVLPRGAKQCTIFNPRSSRRSDTVAAYIEHTDADFNHAPRGRSDQVSQISWDC